MEKTKGYTSIYGYQVSKYMNNGKLMRWEDLQKLIKIENLIKDHTACRRGYIPHPDGIDVFHVYKYKKRDFDGYAVLSVLYTSYEKISTRYVAITYYRKGV